MGKGEARSMTGMVLSKMRVGWLRKGGTRWEAGSRGKGDDTGKGGEQWQGNLMPMAWRGLGWRSKWAGSGGRENAGPIVQKSPYTAAPQSGPHPRPCRI